MNYLRESDNTCHRLADIQARLFKEASREGLPSLSFIRSFLCLSEVRKMDDLSFLYGNLSEQEVYALAKSHLNKQSGGTLFSQNEMHWIGYIYRTIAYMSGIPSRSLARLIAPKYLQEVYPLYHSLDAKQAVEKIFFDLNIAVPDDALRLKTIIRQSYQQENRM